MDTTNNKKEKKDKDAKELPGLTYRDVWSETGQFTSAKSHFVEITGNVIGALVIPLKAKGVVSTTCESKGNKLQINITGGGYCAGFRLYLVEE